MKKRFLNFFDGRDQRNVALSIEITVGECESYYLRRQTYNIYQQ